MPAARHFSWSPFMALAVMATIQVCRWFRSATAYFRGGRIAVHFRHLAIHEHDVVRDAPQRLDGLKAIGDGIGAMAEFLELADGHALIHRIILGDQDAFGFWAGRLGSLGRDAAGRGKGRSFPDSPRALAMQSKRPDWRTGLNWQAEKPWAASSSLEMRPPNGVRRMRRVAERLRSSRMARPKARPSMSRRFMSMMATG